MATTTIDAEVLKKLFLAGAANLEAKKEWINDLNVFPVPDGDTGTNMTLTIMSAAKEVNSLAAPTMQTLSKAISGGSLRGARGNSGVILSQLLRGFTKVVRDYDELDSIIISTAFQKAVETAKGIFRRKPGGEHLPQQGSGALALVGGPQAGAHTVAQQNIVPAAHPGKGHAPIAAGILLSPGSGRNFQPVGRGLGIGSPGKHIRKLLQIHR